MEEIIARKYSVLANVLNERQRRLWAASETLSLGRGGLSLVSRATGILCVTINQGTQGIEYRATAFRHTSTTTGWRTQERLRPSTHLEIDA